MKPVTGVAAAAVVALGGVLWYQSQETAPVVSEVETPAVLDEVVPEAAEPAQAEAQDTVDPAATLEEAATAVVEQGQNAMGAARDAVDAAVDEAADAVSETAQDTVDAVTDAASGALDRATGAAAGTAEEATQAANEAVEGAAETAGDVVGNIADTVAEGVDTSVEALTETVDQATAASNPQSLLTTEGFDFDKVVEMIKGSKLDALKKATLISALTQAQDKPELLQPALDQVKSALGL